MLEYFTFLLPSRLLIIGAGITFLSMVEIGQTELKCIKQNQGEKYCELTQIGFYWSKHIQKFNLKNIVINSVASTELDRDLPDKYHTVYSHSLIFNTEREAIDLGTYWDLQKPKEIKQKVDYFIDNENEKLLVLKYPNLSLTDIIHRSIGGIYMIYTGLFCITPK